MSKQCICIGHYLQSLDFVFKSTVWLCKCTHLYKRPHCLFQTITVLHSQMTQYSNDWSHLRQVRINTGRNNIRMAMSMEVLKSTQQDSTNDCLWKTWPATWGQRMMWCLHIIVSTRSLCWNFWNIMFRQLPISVSYEVTNCIVPFLRY